jgi:hypothetical protein
MSAGFRKRKFFCLWVVKKGFSGDLVVVFRWLMVFFLFLRSIGRRGKKLAL